jgi:hypothetical protein
MEKEEYWKEKELETAMRLLSASEGWDDRSVYFDPVKFSIMEAKRFIAAFREANGF